MIQVELTRTSLPLFKIGEEAGRIALGAPEIDPIVDLEYQASIEARAWQLIENRQTFPTAEVKRQEYFNNGRTALMEAMTASGHLSRVVLTGSIDEINAQVLSRLLNSWDDSLPLHETMRRFAELCNELKIQDTHKAVAEGKISPKTKVVEISDYPMVLGKDATRLGYRWQNLKGMVRVTGWEYLGEGEWRRVIEQGSRSNGTFASTLRFYKARGMKLPTDIPEDIITLATPIISDQLIDGAIDVMRELDRYSGPHIRYGEIKNEKQIPYEKLREESARREGQIELYSNKLADLEEQLHDMVSSGQIPESEKLEIYKGEIERALSAICTLQPEYAAATFGEKAAVYFNEAQDLFLRGMTAQAGAMLTQADFFKQTVTFCGVSVSVKSAIGKGLKLNAFTDLLEEGAESDICTYTLDKCPGAGCDAENVTVTSRKENGVTVATASPCGCTKRFE